MVEIGDLIVALPITVIKGVGQGFKLIGKGLGRVRDRVSSVFNDENEEVKKDGNSEGKINWNPLGVDLNPLKVKNPFAKKNKRDKESASKSEEHMSSTDRPTDDTSMSSEEEEGLREWNRQSIRILSQLKDFQDEENQKKEIADQRVIEKSQEEDYRQRLLDLQIDLYGKLSKCDSLKLFKNLKDGNGTISMLVVMLITKKEESFTSMLEDNYEIDPMSAQELLNAVISLRNQREENQKWFKLYLDENLIREGDDQSTSQLTSTTIQQLIFKPAIEDQLLSCKEGRRKMLTANHIDFEKEVAVKLSDNLDSLNHEIAILSSFTCLNQSQKCVVNSYDSIYENLCTFQEVDYHGLLIEKGGDNLQEYLLEASSNLNRGAKKAEFVVEVVRFIHLKRIVWLDCKLSNVVRFPTSFPEWRGIDFEHSLEVGEEIPSHHGCTVLYAPPELVRWLYGSSSGGGRLVSSKSMEMWSVGVCLMEIATGETLKSRLNVPIELEDYYLTFTDDEIKQNINNMLSTTLAGNSNVRLRELLSLLLNPAPEERITIEAVLSHSYFTEEFQDPNSELFANMKGLHDKVDELLDNNDNIAEGQMDINQQLHMMRSNRNLNVDEN